MHIVNTLLMIWSMLQTINRVKSANYHLFLSLNKLLSASAWSSLSYLLEFLLKKLPDDFTRGALLIFKESSFQLLVTFSPWEGGGGGGGEVVKRGLGKTVSQNVSIFDES